MPRYVIAMIAAICLTSPAVAQAPSNGSAAPPAIGNRANGRDYQPTPAEVIPREKAAGALPDATREKAENRDLEQIDKDVLRQEGQSTQSVPKLTNRQ